MPSELAVINQSSGELTFNQEKIQLIKDTICKGATDLELKMFLEVCKTKKLDPLARQIHAVKRWDSTLGREVWSYQVGIDGFRTMAQRTGQYAGQDEPLWCGEDGVWRDVWLKKEAPQAAKVAVYKNGFEKPLARVALYREYVQVKKDGNPNSMWAKMPTNQLAKCFSEDTEVLTERGFVKFPEVAGTRIMQVCADGTLEGTSAVQFSQEYEGPMICHTRDMLDFSVTPNHDMVTTVGKVEAGAIYETSTKARPLWYVPMYASGGWVDSPNVADDDLRLAGYVLADGAHNGHNRFVVSVSRPHKIAALDRLSPASTGIRHSRGDVAIAEKREIRTNFDKKVYSFELHRICEWVGSDKTVSPAGILKLSSRQARILLSAWQSFDGYTNKKTGVLRIYTSRQDHVKSIELLACLAGLSVSVPKERTSDISERPNYCITLSEPRPQPVIKASMSLAEAPNRKVWCVTVPSGRIIVRRKGFSFVCGNCAEALALRAAFPEELSGLYTPDEMGQADNPQEAIRSQKEVLDRRLKEVRSEEPVDEQLSDLESFNRQIEQASKNQVNVVLTNLVTEMAKHFSADEAKAELDRILARFNVAKSADLDLDQKRELAKLLFQSIKAKREFAQPIEEDITPDSLLVLWEEMTDIASTVNVFQRLKDELAAIVGESDAEKIYRAALNRQGVTHSNLFKGDKTKGARPALKEIFDHLQVAKKQSDGEDIRDEDIPK